MQVNRVFCAMVLAACIAGGVLAQGKPLDADDETIFTRVEEVLQGDRSLGRARIAVSSRDGFVTLTGFADTMEDIATAGRLAAAVRGVLGVTNRIRIADRGWRA